MNYNHPIITDSGGFQVFSLAYGSVKRETEGGETLQSQVDDSSIPEGIKKQRKFAAGSSVLKISEEGVLFRSYRDYSKVLLTPETSVQAQKDLGADIIVPFDELPPYHIDNDKLKKSLDRTHRYIIFIYLMNIYYVKITDTCFKMAKKIFR